MPVIAEKRSLTGFNGQQNYWPQNSVPNWPDDTNILSYTDRGPRLACPRCGQNSSQRFVRDGTSLEWKSWMGEINLPCAECTACAHVYKVYPGDALMVKDGYWIVGRGHIGRKNQTG